MSSSSCATSWALPVIVPTRMVSSSAIGSPGRDVPLVFRLRCIIMHAYPIASIIFHIRIPPMGAREPSRKPARKDPGTVVQLDAAFLDRLGERVREARARRGMTRKILARDSGVSERYLAQLESGRGNVSVLLLRQIAQALNLPVNDLVRDENGQSVELTLIEQFLKRLPA